MRVLYCRGADGTIPFEGSEPTVQEQAGRATVRLDLPSAAMAILA
jgi:hypothetical protein